MNIEEQCERDELEFEGITNLMAALFRLTAQDVKMGHKDAIDFLNSQWFDTICIGMLLETKKVKFLILNNRVRSRISYE